LFEPKTRILSHPAELDYRTVFTSGVVVETYPGCHAEGNAVRKTGTRLGRLVFMLHVYGAANPATDKRSNLKSLSASQRCINEEGG